MKENKTIYVLFDWVTLHVIMSTYTKTKALAMIGELLLCGDRVNNLKILELDASEVED